MGYLYISTVFNIVSLVILVQAQQPKSEPTSRSLENTALQKGQNAYIQLLQDNKNPEPLIQNVLAAPCRRSKIPVNSIPLESRNELSVSAYTKSPNSPIYPTVTAESSTNMPNIPGSTTVNQKYRTNSVINPLEPSLDSHVRASQSAIPETMKPSDFMSYFSNRRSNDPPSDIDPSSIKNIQSPVSPKTPGNALEFNRNHYIPLIVISPSLESSECQKSKSGSPGLTESPSRRAMSESVEDQNGTNVVFVNPAYRNDYPLSNQQKTDDPIESRSAYSQFPEDPSKAPGVVSMSGNQVVLIENPRVCFACSTVNNPTCWHPDRRTTVKYCHKEHNACVTRTFKTKDANILIRDCGQTCDDFSDIPGLTPKYDFCSVCHSDLCNFRNAAISIHSVQIFIIIALASIAYQKLELMSC